MADLRVDTNKMTAYADRIDTANQRIAALDRQLNSLYFSFGLLDVFRIIQADMLLSYSSTLQQCSRYLRETASNFENIERTLAAQDPLNFDAAALLGAVAFNPRDILGHSGSNISLIQLIGMLALPITGVGFSPIGALLLQDLITGNFQHDGHFNVDLFDDEGHLTFQNLDIWGMFSDQHSLFSAEGSTDLLSDWVHLHGGLDVLTGGVYGEGRFQFFQDGEYDPALELALGGKVTGLHLFGDASVGDDQFGTGVSGEANLGYAAAGFDVRSGNLGQDAYGTDVYGMTVSGDLIASAAQLSAERTYTLFGIDFKVGVGWDPLAVGADFDAGMTTRGGYGSLEVADVEGLQISFGIDWTDNRDICNAIDWVVDQDRSVRTAAFNYVADRWNQGVDMAHDAWDAGYEWGQNTWNTVQETWNAGVENVQEAWDNGVDMWNSGVDTARDWWDSGMDTLQEAGENVLDFLHI